MNDVEVESRLKDALGELAEATPLANPDRPRSGHEGLGRSPADPTGSTDQLVPSASGPATRRAPWLDVKVLALAACVVIIAVGIFFVGRQIAHGRSSPTTRTTVPVSRTVTVPNFVGAGLPSLDREARAAGVTLHFDFVRSRRPTASVISQSPSSGSQVPRGGVVSLAISNGDAPPPAAGATETVPNVVGLGVYQALLVIQSAGLTNSMANPARCGSDATKARVTTQAPAAGSKVPQDSPVSLTFSCS